MNADLHCHSRASDGLLAADILAERARNRGVELISLTDHDDLSALADMRREAEARGLRFVDGVEISACWRGIGIHVLGLNVDPGDPSLVAGLQAIRDSRAARAVAMGESLARSGIDGALAGALSYAGNPALVSRTHFARFLAERGHARDVRSVFQRFLIEGKPGFVAHQWASLADAVRWVRDSGGQAVVAHPGRYPLSEAALREFLEEFRALGGSGIEVISGAHTPDQHDNFAALAREFGLLGSRGSDFHGPGESRFDLGSLPPLPQGINPVWSAW
ncbi:MAG: PHP domain-containing protein [Betaproteobacteria bacterium]|nr:PHP domain-containing protein [Betaproteobacteria bacterium]